MVKSFASLFNDEDTADMHCSMMLEKVHVHKEFVKLCSEPLISKLLKNNEITQMEKSVLKFFYTGKIDNLASQAKELIELAQNYKIPVLTAYCEKTLITSLRVGNVLETFIIASRTNSLTLRKKSLKMIQKGKKHHEDQQLETACQGEC